MTYNVFSGTLNSIQSCLPTENTHVSTTVQLAGLLFMYSQHFALIILALWTVQCILTLSDIFTVYA